MSKYVKRFLCLELREIFYYVEEVVLNIKLLIVYILNEGRHIEYLHLPSY